jgi:UDP-N-acetyl-D-glucosamine dehydrogenase
VTESDRTPDIIAAVAGSRLRERILSREAIFGVIGIGYVGLPLAVSLAGAGIATIGFDVKADIVAQLSKGESHVPDVPASEVTRLVRDNRLTATTDMSRLREADVISICVPTPLGKTRDPDMSHVATAIGHIREHLRAGQLVILESTTYPGTTREILLPQLEAGGLQAGRDFFLAFSPERIDPGNTRYLLENTPKIVGGFDEVSTALACEFYRHAIEQVVPVSSLEVAEMVKLHENTFRAVNIALANEAGLICDRLGIDIWEVIDAAATKPFGFMPFYPGPGVGGHCIPLDPHYLSWKMKTLNYRTRFIELASEVNSSMPYHVVSKVTQRLNQAGKSVNGANILIIGVSYKPDVNDTRESPALDIIALLAGSGATISYHDPMVPELSFLEFVLQSRELTEDVVRRADCVVIVTRHSMIDMAQIRSWARALVDTRGPSRR